MCSLRSPVWSAAIKIVVHDEPVSSKSRWARREHTYNTQKLRGTPLLTFPQKNKNRRVQSTIYPRPAHNIFRPIRADLCPGVGALPTAGSCRDSLARERGSHLAYAVRILEGALVEPEEPAGWAGGRSSSSDWGPHFIAQRSSCESTPFVSRLGMFVLLSRPL